ncbi:probable methyltransferase PMT24 [Impatiens glandulifera]|uniref:probable methyltransferase PMT24 n=1 Tax=Impatiens glandulifera TaxID=253017 RepID=UPI001FB090F9|nr:probable methyltransferase PMT24 [Impatiens glandulifera]
MALGKYSRVDGRKSSNYCSTLTVVVFVAVCLAGVWMLMSSSVVPIQDMELSTDETTTSGVVQDLNGKNFEDTSGDINAVDRETNVESQELTTQVTETTEDKTENESNPEKEENDEVKSEELESKSNLSDDSNSEDGGGEAKSEENTGETDQTTTSTTPDSEVAENKDENSNQENIEDNGQEKNSNEVFKAASQSEILNETTTQNGPWSTQAAESENEKQSQKTTSFIDSSNSKWKLCNVTAGPDYIPCLDNIKAIRKLPSTNHYEHRERHCPDEPPTCLVPLPEGYRKSVSWPKSREQIWYYNVPHTKLAEVKGHQNWVKVTGDHLTFPGGGTQFKNGALHYIDFLQNSFPEIAWGKQTRVILDVGCGVASFGGFLFERDVLAMSFAPKDEHEAQVQFALERGIPAISAVMGTKRLPYPSKVFDLIHCARCRVPWHVEGGKLLLELNRLLRPGGFFVWSATPVYRKNEEDSGIWKAMSRLTKSMCWELMVIKKDKLNEVGAAIYRKPITNDCYENRPKNDPPLCDDDTPDAAWNVPLQACIHKVAVSASERGSKWPAKWPKRLEKAPYWLKSSQVGVYGKPAPEDFTNDYEHWKQIVSSSYTNSLGINWSSVRNVMDMKAVYGGFAAALKDMKVWVMNIVPINSPDTLPIIYERGLIGMYHDWCESFSAYPRTYDLIHADNLFSDIKKRCNIKAVIAEVDRILRPEGRLIVRDDVDTIAEVESLAKSLHWKIQMTYSKDEEGFLCVKKTVWRPVEIETIMSAIA